MLPSALLETVRRGWKKRTNGACVFERKGETEREKKNPFPPSLRSVARCAYIGSNHVRLFKLFVRPTRRKMRRGVRSKTILDTDISFFLLDQKSHSLRIHRHNRTVCFFFSLYNFPFFLFSYFSVNKRGTGKVEGNTLPVKSRFAGKGNETLRRCFDNAFRLHHPVLDVAQEGETSEGPRSECERRNSSRLRSWYRDTRVCAPITKLRTTRGTLINDRTTGNRRVETAIVDTRPCLVTDNSRNRAPIFTGSEAGNVSYRASILAGHRSCWLPVFTFRTVLRPRSRDYAPFSRS